MTGRSMKAGRQQRCRGQQYAPRMVMNHQGSQNLTARFVRSGRRQDILYFGVAGRCQVGERPDAIVDTLYLRPVANAPVEVLPLAACFPGHV